MESRIEAWEQDEAGDWIAHLDCGHRQHVRHRPPFQERPWVETEEGRATRLGSPIECRLCDEEVEQGGEAACLAGRLCPECGAVEGEAHRTSCRAGASDRSR